MTTKNDSSVAWRKLEYINEGRGGYVVYKDNLSTIKLSFEFGGGNCVVIIFVPTPLEWVEQTNRPISDRQSILTFIATQSIKDQAPNCKYTLSDQYIELLSR
jgi:hypothetical protein